MEARKQFTFYRSFFESISLIKRKSDRADAYDALCRYALFGVEPDLSALPESVQIGFLANKANVDVSRRKAANGRRGGCSRQTPGCFPNTEKQTQANPKQTPGKKEIEAEVEKEEEREEERESEYECTLPLTPSQTPPVPEPKLPAAKTAPVREIVELYTTLCPSLPKCTHLADVTGYMIPERWKQFGSLDAFREAFRKAEASSFLTGRKNGWRANLDWLMTGDNLAKVLNGNYSDVSSTGGGRSIDGVRQPDAEEVEAVRRMMESEEEP